MVFGWIQTWPHVMWQLEEQEVLGQVVEEWWVELEEVTFALCAALGSQGVVYLGQVLWKGDSHPGQVH